LAPVVVVELRGAENSIPIRIMSRSPGADSRVMESATVTVLGHPSPVRVERALYAYLLSINPFHNFRRWMLAQFIYWGALMIIGAISSAMSLLA
jgi:hypothetical protein